jgi:hypothetical protein
MSALPLFSDVDLLRYGERIFDLNSEIADRTHQLSLTSASPRNQSKRLASPY